MKKLRATIDPLQEKGKINRELYGQFIEQAGRIVYGGLFVGKDSPIPNEDGVRLDVIQAYRTSRCRCSTGPAAGWLIPTIGWTASALRRKESP